MSVPAKHRVRRARRHTNVIILCQIWPLKRVHARSRRAAGEVARMAHLGHSRGLVCVVRTKLSVVRANEWVPLHLCIVPAISLVTIIKDAVHCGNLRGMRRERVRKYRRRECMHWEGCIGKRMCAMVGWRVGE